MARINVTGRAVVITSTIKHADIEKVRKYRPDALVLYEGEGDAKKPIFAINCGEPQANSVGIVFDGKTHDENGYATYTQLIPSFAGDVKESIADLYGATLINLNKMEAIFPQVIEEIKNEREAVLGQITLE